MMGLPAGLGLYGNNVTSSSAAMAGTSFGTGVNTNLTALPWAVAMSDSGQYILVGGYGTKPSLSTNSGASFSLITVTGMTDVTAVAVSGDGSVMLCGCANGSGVNELFYSTNYGASWTRITGTTLSNVQAVGVSNNGNVLIGIDISGRVAYSLNRAVSWSNASFPITECRSLDISSNGSVIYAGGGSSTSKAYKSTNYGASWTLLSALPATCDFYYSIGCSGNGNILAGFNLYDSKLYLSTDGGTSFTSQTITGGSQHGRYLLSSDGARIAYFNASDSKCYRSQNTGATFTPGSAIASFGMNLPYCFCGNSDLSKIGIVGTNSAQQKFYLSTS